ncbi:putative palmitoyltransferase ZDHHC22 [Arapaima gigas]
MKVLISSNSPFHYSMLLWKLGACTPVPVYTTHQPEYAPFSMPETPRSCGRSARPPSAVSLLALQRARARHFGKKARIWATSPAFARAEGQVLLRFLRAEKKEKEPYLHGAEKRGGYDDPPQWINGPRVRQASGRHLVLNEPFRGTQRLAAEMYIKMLRLRLLNAIAPAYFCTATAITFALHFYLFIPTIFPSPGGGFSSSILLHSTVFLYLMLNALGNYTMTIRHPAESPNEKVIPVCSPDCPDRVDAHYLLNGRHFCKLCKKVILRRDHHCFFTGNCIGNRNMRYFIMFCIYTSCTCLYSLVLGVAYLTVEYSISFESPLTFLTLLPLSTGYFFLGAISGLQFFLVLMLYVWLGIGLTSAGFCCQQVLLVARGQTWCQMRSGHLAETHGSWRDNLSDVFGSRWALGIFFPVQTVEALPGDTIHKYE